ncbi:MAG: hypothetical protein R3343_10760 [Nitriliruptorales bacterium]|nr:hypothetical protein [Nitriliruptorales bacterium]
MRIEITTTVTDPGDACLDSLEIQLEQPLGQRVLIDATSGARLEVRRAP